MGPRPGPERTCVGCRKKAGKNDLLRIVRTPQGDVRIDGSGKGPGRGAYVHGDRACVEAALGRGALARSLRMGLRAKEAARLGEAIERKIEAEVER